MNPGTKVKLSDNSDTWVVKGESFTAPHQVALIREDEETGLRISLSRSPGDLIVVKDAPVYTMGQVLNYRGHKVEVIVQTDAMVQVTFLDYKFTTENGDRLDVVNDPPGAVLVCDLVLANPLAS